MDRAVLSIWFGVAECCDITAIIRVHAIYSEFMLPIRPLLTVALLWCLGAAPRPAIVPASEWGSKPQAIAESRKHVPRFIRIHHAGVLWKAGDDPVKKLAALQAWGQREKGWPDLPYHYLIAPDGRIFE